MFDKILIANRGEIALRILRACQEWASRRSRSTRPPTPTRCTCGSPTRPSASARRRRATATSTSRRIIAAAEITDADAIHPGYGFLSENARFAEIVESHDIIFIGPKPEHIRMMGDKIEAKRTASEARPAAGARLGRRRSPDDDEAKRIAAEIGYPVLIKAAAGGGGRGMKVARSRGRARAALMSHGARRGQAPRSATTPSTSRNISATRATSNSRCSATARATPSISASATARCSAATRRCSRKAPSPALNAERARADRRDRRARRWPSWAIAAPARSSSSTRTASSTSSR